MNDIGHLFTVFILLAKIYKCFTINQGLRHSVFVCLLVPHVNTERPGKEEIRGQNVTLLAATESRSLMRYCDTDSPIYDHDEFMHRIVAIVKHNSSSDTIGSGQICTTGVFINHNHVLTAYKPFKYMMNKVSKSRMYIYYYIAKWFEGGKHHGYYIGTEKFACARRVVYRRWTLDDLMVIKTERNVTFLKAPFWRTEPVMGLRLYYVGPLQTELAGQYDDLGYDLKFASLGFIDDDHIYNRNHLHTVEFNRRDIEDCEEWFPRDWGYFICIANVENYVGIASGAFLFSEGKVFGVGQLAIKKDGKSIHMFTDVRPYSEMINLTCTKADH